MNLKRLPVGIALGVSLGALVAGCAPQKNTEVVASPPTAATRVERGRHIVEGVGMCGDCHTPFLPTGQHDLERWLRGAPLMFKPTVEMPWAEVAPPIAGLPSMSDEQAIRFLMTGELPPGREPLRPPMPAYRMAREEAEAVVAYLRSLGT